ncbi:hypothetical protein [Peijinzhouia sedimentorum]
MNYAESPYEFHNGQLGVKRSFLISDTDKKHERSLEVKTYAALQKEAQRKKGLRIKEGKGPGNETLISWQCMPTEWREMCKQHFGNPESEYNALEKHFEINGEAKAYYDKFQFENDKYLKAEQKEQYTINASVLDAVISLKAERTMSRKSRGGSVKGLWDSLAADVVAFQDKLKTMGHIPHTLPSTAKWLRPRVKSYINESYYALIDGRNNNSNAKVVTPEMIELWQNIYAGQRDRKPTYIEVHIKYEGFLKKKLDIYNNATGEQYNPDSKCYRQASANTIYNYQSAWAQRIVSNFLRSGDRQKFKSSFEPFHKLRQPKFAGSIISIDDRQPPFEYAPGKRMWFYNAIDLGSEAFTCWVYGESKEGIILDFYRQLARNYTAWGLNLPYELECEMSLNSSFKDNLLSNGAMFQQVRIEANNARGKRIEAYYRQLRYNYEKDEDGWIARPFALSESNQKGKANTKIIPREEIVQKALRAIERWNNTLHSNQDLNPGLSRWEVFLQKQHPELTPTNWAGILPFIGYKEKTSMKLGRITLQGKHRVVGFNGEVALGDRLIQLLSRIEGKQVIVRWLDDVHGDVMKSLVYSTEGELICELLSDLEYSKSTLETTESDKINRKLTSAYSKTVQSYFNEKSKLVDYITIDEHHQEVKNTFSIADINNYKRSETPAEALPEPDDDLEEMEAFKRPRNWDASTASRF